MKKILFALLAVATVAVAAPRAASAQTAPALVKVPFQFLVGDSVLPAGSYRFACDKNSSLLVVTSLDGKSSAVFAVTEQTDNAAPMDAQAHVAFKTFGGQHFLSRVSLPGSESRDVVITRAGAERTLARLNLAAADRADVAK